MKLTKTKKALILCLLFSLLLGVSTYFSITLTSKTELSGNLSASVLPAENASVNSQGIDMSIFAFTIIGDRECSVKLTDKTVTKVIVPSVTIINNVEYAVTAIAANGFSNSNTLEKAWLPKSIKTIYSAAFMGCRNLKHVIFSAVESIGMNAFAVTNLEYLILPETVTSVAATILRNCTTPVYVRATEDQITNLWHSDWNGYNKDAFIEYGSNFIPPIQYRFEEIEVVSPVSTLGAESRTVSGYVVEGYQPFVTESGLDIYIPAEHEGKPVIEIEDSAFMFNTMNTITVGYSDTPIRIGSFAFYYFEGSTVTINRDVIFEDDYGNPSESVFLGTMASTIIMPDTITQFGDYTFQDSFNLTDIHFIAPKLSTQADEQALVNSLVSIKVVSLPKTITTLGSYVFGNITGITELKIPNSVVTVGENIFENWDKPQTIKIAYESESALGDGWSTSWNKNCNLSIIEYSKPQIYTITYILNEGTHTGNPETYTPKEAVSLKDATREGYTFDGWYNESDVKLSEIAAGTVGNLVLEAKWTPIQYTIKYDANKPDNASGEIKGTTVESIHTYDFTSSLRPNGYILEGWFFNGWKDENGKAYNETADVLNLSIIDKDTVTFYAQWLPRDYSVSYHENRPGAASFPIEGNMEKTPHVYDTPSALRINKYKLQGWTFIGWKDAEDNFYTDGQEITTAAKGGTATLLAQWVQNDYKITYNPNKPSNASNSVTGSMNENNLKFDANAINLNNNNFALKGWKFNGWNTNANGSGISYSDKQSVKNLSNKANGIVELYAQWKPYTYYIVYNGNGASGSMNNTVQYYDTPFTLNENLFYKAGYHSNIWNTLSNGGGTAYNTSTTYYNLSDIDGEIIDLYAQWLQNEYYIYYDANGGTGNTPYTKQLYDAPLKLAENQFTRDGYGFAGWSETPNGAPITWITNPGSQIIHNFVESGSVTLYAVWNEFKYSVRFSGYCNYEGTSSKFGNTPTYTMKKNESRTKTAPNSCGNPKGGTLACGCDFDHWEIRSDKGKSWNDTNKTITVLNFTEINGEHFEITAIYVEPTNQCVAHGTMITLADGSQKAVEDLTGNELLLTWNLKTGTFDYAPILFIDSDPAQMYEVINLFFADGTTVKVISEHGFWNFDLNQYVYLRNDAAKYIGNWFNKQTTDASGNMVWTKVQLVNVVVQNEYTSAWSPVTYSHMCYYVNGMLSMPGGTESLVNIFDVDANTMKINETAFNADIEKYGLFTYEEFAEVVPIPESIFHAFNGEYLKVAMGKGLINWDEIQTLVERYSEFFMTNN